MAPIYKGLWRKEPNWNVAGRSAQEDGRQPPEERAVLERRAGAWGLRRAPGSVAETEVPTTARAGTVVG